MHAQAERQVPVEIASKIEPVRVVEFRQVAICRADADRYESTCGNTYDTEYCCNRSNAITNLVGALEAQKFLNCGSN